MTYLKELLRSGLFQLPFQTLGQSDALLSHPLPGHDLCLTFVVQPLLPNFEHIHCLLIKLTFFLRQHQLVILISFVLSYHLLRALELAVKLVIEILPLAFLLLNQTQRFVIFSLLLENSVLVHLIFIFALLVGQGQECMLISHKTLVLRILSIDFKRAVVNKAVCDGLVFEAGHHGLFGNELVYLVLLHEQLVIYLGQFRLYRLELLIHQIHVEQLNFFPLLVRYLLPDPDLIHPSLAFHFDCFSTRVLLFHKFLVITFGLHIISEFFATPVFSNTSQPLSLQLAHFMLH